MTTYYDSINSQIATKALGNVLSTNIGKYLFVCYRDNISYERWDRKEYEESRKPHPTRVQERMAAKLGYAEGCRSVDLDVLVALVVESAIDMSGYQIKRRDAVRAINYELSEYNDGHDALPWNEQPCIHQMYDLNRYYV